MSGPIKLDHMMGRWVTGGSPWHGRVEGGVLTLPNGATMAWAQPGSGSVLLQQRPGFGPGLDKLSLGVEQDAADATAGRQWLNYAIIAGDQLYGKELTSGHLWTDTNGNVWQVFINPPVELAANALRWNVSLYPHWEFGRARSVQSYSVDMTDTSWVAAASNFYFIGGDASLDGSRKVYSVTGYRQPNIKMQTAPGSYFPIAYFELTLSGAGESATFEASVLRTAAQTNTVTNADSLQAANYNLWAVSEAVFTDTCYGPGAPGDNFDYTITTDFVWKASSESAPPGPASGFGGVRNVGGQANLTWGSWLSTQTTIADVRYDASGNASDVVSTVVISRTLSSDTLPIVGSVSQTQTEVCGAGPSPVEDSFSINWQGGESATATITLTFGGQTLASASLTANFSTSSTMQGKLTAVGQAGAMPEITSANFSDSGGVSSSLGGGTSRNRTNVAGPHQNQLLVGMTGTAVASTLSSEITAGAALGCYVQITGEGSPRIYAEAFRWTAYMWGLREHLRTTEAPVWNAPATVLTFRYGGAVGKWGSAGAVTTQNAPYVMEQRYGTEDPITGAAEIGRANPVCYV